MTCMLGQLVTVLVFLTYLISCVGSPIRGYLWPRIRCIYIPPFLPVFSRYFYTISAFVALKIQFLSVFRERPDYMNAALSSRLFHASTSSAITLQLLSVHDYSRLVFGGTHG